ncbi:nucleotide exchange factor GrpE [Candidatus Woesebacteria bacterium]|nr:nucleotide exchange factor GrpE [Candidatus Woesebacteria bacterium]MCD8526814.1 nucleotide exchange factor GrpE [Candidatus Woesebacteria bacterium]MCD8545965.1 nucleotide exchange factor GrpE [Candidatus Woesebacteria bacterium]
MSSPQKQNHTQQPNDAGFSEEFAQLQQLVVEKEEAHKRALADYQNLLRRSTEEKKALVASANQNIVADLLPTLDHLEMAMQHYPDGSLQMIVNDLKKTLENYGLQKMEVVGKPFDANTMEAVDTADGESGHVVREQRSGYTLHGTVLRHAEVVVGK